MALKRKTVFLIAAGAAAVALGGLLLALLLTLRSFKPRIEAAVSDYAGMEVSIGRAGVYVFPGFGLSLRDVGVRNGEAAVVTADRMRIGLKLFPLLRGEVRLTGIGFTKPVFTIARDKNGTYSFEKPGPAAAVAPFAVKKISIAHGKLVYTEESSGVRIETEDFDAVIRDLSYNGKAGPKPFNDLSFYGETRCEALAAGRFPLKKVAARISGRDGVLDLNPVGLELFGGAGSGTLHADFTGPESRYRLTAALHGFSLMEMFMAPAPGAASPRDRMEGTVNLTASLEAAGDSVTVLKRSLSGSLSLNGENLTLFGLDIDALIPKYERSQNFNLIDVGAFFLAGPFGPALTKSYNLGSAYMESRGGKGNISKLVSVWDVKNGIARAEDVAMATKKYRLAMKGGLDFNLGRFADVRVAVLDKQGCAVFSQSVSGSFLKPSVGKGSIFKSLAGPAANVLGSAWGLVQGCKVYYSGSVAHPVK